jgi:Xaa-Pro aminopeptidase
VDEELKPLTFKEGMILTIEPGIYIDKNDKSVPKRYRGIAIRIEDDILVKKDGYENLSKDIIKSVDEIEKLMQCI